MENTIGKKIKVLQLDNSGEYMGKSFEEFCARAGIKKELIVQYNPQQNGVAEHKNKFIVGVARAMLYDQDLPNFLWAEACCITIYIQNRCSHKVLGKMMHKETFAGKNPNISHFRSFECVVYCHVPSDKRMKLDFPIEKGIFVVYNKTYKEYKIYIPTI